jgi:hypothetical protein
MTGQLNILKDTMRAIINTHQEQDGDVFKANMAVWFYNKHGKRYLTFELSLFIAIVVNDPKRT